MKYLGIRKGASGLLFSAIPGPFAEGQQLADSASSNKADTGLISEQLKKELAKEGIPSEVRRLYAQVADLENKISLGVPVNRRAIYSLLAKINLVIQQSKDLNSAVKHAYDSGSIDDIAVNQRGALFVRDEKGAIKQVSFADFDVEKDTPLTVGELINERKNNDQFIDNQDITNIIRSNVGIELVNDYIQKIINTVGSAESATEAYQDLTSIVGQAAKQPNSDEFNAIKGIQNEFQQLGAKAIFKVASSSKDRNIQEAFQYIMSMLPKSMRSQLIGNYLGHGGLYEHSDDFVQNVVKTAILSANDSKRTYKIDYDQQMNKAAGNVSDSAGKPKQHNLSMMELFFNRDLNHTKVTISDPTYDNKTALEVSGSIIPGLTTDKNKSLSNLPLSLALSGEGMGKYLDYSKIFMGYEHVPEGMLQDITYTQGDVANVMLPVTANGDIDFMALQNYSKAEKEIDLKGVSSPDEKNKIHQKNGSYARYDASGKMTDSYGRMAPYLMLHGYTIDDLVDSDNSMVRELTGNEEDSVDTVLKSIYKGTKKLTGTSKISGKQSWDDIILVPIFIKIKDNAAINAATYAGYGSLVDTNTLERSMMQQEMQTSIPASGAQLYE